MLVVVIIWHDKVHFGSPEKLVFFLTLTTLQQNSSRLTKKKRNIRNFRNALWLKHWLRQRIWTKVLQLRQSIELAASLPAS